MFTLRMLLRKPATNGLFVFFLALSSLFVWFSLEVSSVLLSSTDELSYEFSSIVVPRSHDDVEPLEDIGRGGDFTGFPGHVSQNYGMMAYSPQFHPVISSSSDPLTLGKTPDAPYNCIVFSGVCTEAVIENYGTDSVQTALFSVLDVYALHEDYPVPKRIQTTVNLLLHEDAVPFEAGKRYLLYLEEYQGHMLTGFMPAKDDTYSTTGVFDEDAICSGGFPRYEKFVRNDDGEDVLARDDDVLTFTEFTGEAEDFLFSSEGKRWADKIAYIKKAVSSAELIATEDPASIVAFKDGRTVMAEGRSFSQDELKSGAKVCILSAALAKSSGLKLGDEISVELMDSDYSYYESISRKWISPVFPQAYTGLGNETFTIIGLFALPESQGDMYSFTPSSMFIPVTSLSEETLSLAKTYCLAATNISSLVLRGREWETFENYTTVLSSHFSYQLVGGDYAQFKTLFNDLQNSVKLFRYISFPLWSVLLLVYLVLFWFRSLRNTALMRSQGMSKVSCVWHSFLSGFAPAIPAAVLMLISSRFFMDRAAALLLRRGMGSLVDVEQLARTAIQGAGFDSAIETMLRLFGTLAAGVFAVSILMSLQNIMKLLCYRE